ncbi:helix-turn-helix domain-containing protein [Corynebacterium flavescens]|uniref:helix-turn-helix domain-containing protein n=1 Tax=Corynebacterium flavescens TaxID=28028 RepID=UPI00264836CB|nr:XRE family transcriptional regulator [Corynebacterium flavescens]MDN6227262.1 XRE family transcriptional regulator [Corynebacterium flavescens]
MDGSAIAVARAALGITQKDLSKRLGITQATLSRYENNERHIEDATLAEIGELLGVNFTAFKDVHRPERGPLAAEAHMRRRKSAPVGEWRKCEARLNLTRMEVGLLARRLEISPSLVLPHLDPDDGYTPERAAQIVRSEWGMPIGPVRQIYKWIEAAGVFAFERDLSTARVDGLSQVVDGVAVILINNTFPVDRKRLTIAHELGHIVLHSGTYIPEDPEDEANRFAAEFLMPETAVAPYLNKVDLAKLQALKLEWGVSMRALFERAYHLGKVGREQRTSFYKSMNRRGWKITEPGSDRLPQESP